MVFVTLGLEAEAVSAVLVMVIVCCFSSVVTQLTTAIEIGHLRYTKAHEEGEVGKIWYLYVNLFFYFLVLKRKCFTRLELIFER